EQERLGVPQRPGRGGGDLWPPAHPIQEVFRATGELGDLGEAHRGRHPPQRVRVPIELVDELGLKGGGQERVQVAAELLGVLGGFVDEERQVFGGAAQRKSLAPGRDAAAAAGASSRPAPSIPAGPPRERRPREKASPRSPPPRPRWPPSPAIPAR